MEGFDPLTPDPFTTGAKAVALAFKGAHVFN